MALVVMARKAYGEGPVTNYPILAVKVKWAKVPQARTIAIAEFLRFAILSLTTNASAICANTRTVCARLLKGLDFP